MLFRSGARSTFARQMVRMAPTLAAAATVALGCASGQHPATRHTRGAPNVQTADVTSDESACSAICEASTACGDRRSTCEPKCYEWLVRRSRPGIAGAAASCAIPRIDRACEESVTEPRSAATALVSCVDEAGRIALRKDKTSLLMAARAICERGVRCTDSTMSAEQCVTRIVEAKAAPRGLGVFGAFKPELVRGFEHCMRSSACGSSGGPAACFGEMLGQPGEVVQPETDETPDDSPTDSTTPATKI